MMASHPMSSWEAVAILALIFSLTLLAWLLLLLMDRR